MSTEFDDVLTNQPVVIDNVCLFSLSLSHYFPCCRAPGLSKPVLLVKTILNVFSLRCMLQSFWFIYHWKWPGATSVGRPKHTRVMAGALEGDTFIGRRAQEHRGLLKIKYPMEHGIVTDWDDMERIWNWIYAEELGTLSEEVRSHRATFQFATISQTLASRSFDGGSSQPSEQQGCRCSNIVRYLQCTSSFHFCAGCLVVVRVKS